METLSERNSDTGRGRFYGQSTEGAEMIRKGILALTISVLGTGSVFADEKPAAKPASSGIVSWFRNRSQANADHTGKSAKPAVSNGKRKPAAPAVERAVVSDAERQAAAIRRTSGSVQDKSPAATMPAPLRPAPGTNTQAAARQPAARRMVRPASAAPPEVRRTKVQQPLPSRRPPCRLRSVQPRGRTLRRPSGSLRLAESCDQRPHHQLR